MIVEHVNDRDDPRLADFLDMTDIAGRKRREGDEFFIAEGTTAIERLLSSTHRVRALLVTQPKLERLAPILDDLDAPVYVAPKDVLAATVGFGLHRGAMASADRRPLATIDELAHGTVRLAVLEGLNDPENLGALARSARAFGIDGLVLDPTCIDPYYRRTVRVSMGEILHLRTARAARWPDDLDVLHAAGFETWALTPADDGDDLWTLDPPGRLAVALGAEGPGLRPDTIARCTRRVRIPIAPDVDSLNVGAAAAVAFAALTRGGAG